MEEIIIKSSPDGMKITAPIWSNKDDIQLSNFVNELTDQAINHIYYDKELIALQKIIKKQKEQLDNSIPKEKIQDKIDEVEKDIHLLSNNLSKIEQIKIWRAGGAYEALQELLEEGKTND